MNAHTSANGKTNMHGDRKERSFADDELSVSSHYSGNGQSTADDASKAKMHHGKKRLSIAGDAISVIMHHGEKGRPVASKAPKTKMHRGRKGVSFADDALSVNTRHSAKGRPMANDASGARGHYGRKPKGSHRSQVSPLKSCDTATALVGGTSDHVSQNTFKPLSSIETLGRNFRVEHTTDFSAASDNKNVGTSIAYAGKRVDMTEHTLSEEGGEQRTVDLRSRTKEAFMMTLDAGSGHSTVNTTPIHVPLKSSLPRKPTVPSSGTNEAAHSTSGRIGAPQACGESSSVDVAHEPLPGAIRYKVNCRPPQFDTPLDHPRAKPSLQRSMTLKPAEGNHHVSVTVSPPNASSAGDAVECDIAVRAKTSHEPHIEVNKAREYTYGSAAQACPANTVPHEAANSHSAQGNKSCRQEQRRQMRDERALKKEATRRRKADMGAHTEKAGMAEAEKQIKKTKEGERAKKTTTANRERVPGASRQYVHKSTILSAHQGPTAEGRAGGASKSARRKKRKEIRRESSAEWKESQVVSGLKRMLVKKTAPFSPPVKADAKPAVEIPETQKW